MKDQFQRTIDYARISITDRCNLYCTYCRPDHEEMLSHGEILRYEEILRVCKILTTLGIDKFKITGGEPLVRKGCSDFIRELKKTDGVNKVTLTTNAILLSKDLVKLAEAGVDGINISLDFMDQEKYKKITGFDGYKQVISVINKAVNIGLNIKINVVLTEWTTMEDIQKFIDNKIYIPDNINSSKKHAYLIDEFGNKSYAFDIISDKNIIYSAFLNPDGSKALVVLNSGDSDITATISDGGENFKAVVPAQGVVSCSWK